MSSPADRLPDPSAHTVPNGPYRCCGICGYVEGCEKCKVEGHSCVREGEAPVWNSYESLPLPAAAPPTRRCEAAPRPCAWPACDCDCDCLIPALEGAGQHSPGCRSVKRRDATAVSPAEPRRERVVVALAHLQRGLHDGVAWDESHYAAICEIESAYDEAQHERDTLLRYLGIGHMGELPSGHV